MFGLFARHTQKFYCLTQTRRWRPRVSCRLGDRHDYMETTNRPSRFKNFQDDPNNWDDWWFPYNRVDRLSHVTNTKRRKFWTVQRWTDKLILRQRLVSPRYNYQTRLNNVSRWQVRLYQKSYIISVISPPVDYQASSRLTQWVVAWKESDILPLCFVSAPRASMFIRAFHGC